MAYLLDENGHFVHLEDIDAYLQLEGDTIAGAVETGIGWLPHLDNTAIHASAVIVSDHQLPHYSAGNLIRLPVSSTWRAPSDVLQTVLIDLNATPAIDFVAIVNHNLTSGAMVTLHGWTTGADEISWVFPVNEVTTFLHFAQFYNFQYWQFEIYDPTNTTGVLEIGYIMIGALVKLPFMYRYGWTRIHDEITSRVETEFGTPYVEPMYDRYRLNLNFGPLADAEMQYLRNIYKRTKGSAYPILVIPELSDTKSYFGRLQTVSEETVDFYRYTTVALTEDSLGKSVPL